MTRLLVLPEIFRRCVVFSLISGIVLVFGSAQYAFADTPGKTGKIVFSHSVYTTDRGANIRATCHYGGGREDSSTMVDRDRGFVCYKSLYMKLEPQGCASEKCDVQKVRFQDYCNRRPGYVEAKARGTVWDMTLWASCIEDPPDSAKGAGQVEQRRATEPKQAN